MTNLKVVNVQTTNGVVTGYGYSRYAEKEGRVYIKKVY